MRTWPHGDPSVVIRQILVQPAYRSGAPTSATPPSRTFVDIAWQWFVDHALRPLLQPLARAVAGSHVLGTTVGVALVAVALAGIAFVVVRLVVASVRPVRAARGVAQTEPTVHERSAFEWRAAARAAAQRSDFEGAIAALFAAALRALDERAVVAFDAARTPGDYRLAVRRECAAAAASFDELAERFVRAVYAPETPDARDFAAAERALAAFEPALAA